MALDVFKESPYPKIKNEQTAWISFLATDSLAQAKKLSKTYPWLGTLYEEMAEYLHKPEEVLNMFSEALKILDQNTVQYMIEQQQQELDKVHEELAMTQSQLTETVEKSICSIVALCRDLGGTREIAITQLQEKLQLNSSDAETAVQKYWQ